MSDTPRTDAAWETLPSVYEFIAEVKKLERELNAANAKIKRLAEAFNAAEGFIARRDCGCPYGDEVFYCSSCILAIERYHKTKEANYEQ